MKLNSFKGCMFLHALILMQCCQVQAMKSLKEENNDDLAVVLQNLNIKSNWVEDKHSQFGEVCYVASIKVGGLTFSNPSMETVQITDGWMTIRWKNVENNKCPEGMADTIANDSGLLLTHTFTNEIIENWFPQKYRINGERPDTYRNKELIAKSACQDGMITVELLNLNFQSVLQNLNTAANWDEHQGLGRKGLQYVVPIKMGGLDFKPVTPGTMPNTWIRLGEMSIEWKNDEKRCPPGMTEMYANYRTHTFTDEIINKFPEREQKNFRNKKLNAQWSCSISGILTLKLVTPK